jgi:nitrate/nitrite transporter NarK
LMPSRNNTVQQRCHQNGEKDEVYFSHYLYFVTFGSCVFWFFIVPLVSHNVSASPTSRETGICKCYVFLKLGKCYSRPTLLVRVYAVVRQRS